MPVFTPSRAAQRYLGDADTKTVHDLLREQPECGALDVIARGKGERFIPDKLEMALYIGYKPCPHCLPEYAARTQAAGGVPGPEPAGTGQVERSSS